MAPLPTPATAIAVGLAVFVIGLAFTFGRSANWGLLAQICLVVGALMFCGGVIALGKGSLSAMLIVTAALTAAAIVARSGLLIAAAVFGAIHFYTQWFDYLGPSPGSFMIGGLLMLVFALALWSFNRRYMANA